MLDVLPHNIPAEKSVLGAMISSRDALIEASSGLVVEDFFDLKNQLEVRLTRSLNPFR